MNQEKIMEITGIEREARALEENLQFVDAQLWELENFSNTLRGIMENENKEILSSIGGRAFVKSKIEDSKKLFIEVGAGVVVEKSPEDTLEVVKEQSSKLKEIRVQIVSQLEIYHRKLEEFIADRN
jgi:prefoldin alpha subunit